VKLRAGKRIPGRPAPPDQAEESPLEHDLCVHIFTVSAGMVGVCLTVIGILQLVISSRQADTLADDFLAFDSVLFLLACILSYAITTR
jgi:hypothetical protein